MRDDDYTAGRVLSVIFATILGGISLGQVAPSLPVFAAGKVAGARLHKVIHREPLINIDEKGKVPKWTLRVRSVALCATSLLMPPPLEGAPHFRTQQNPLAAAGRHPAL